MITVACWKYEPKPGYHIRYTSDHVNRLKNSVARNLALDHEFVCITDDAAGLDPDIRIIPIQPETGQTDPNYPARPNCYRRLRAFAPAAADWLGERILALDLDCVILRDITPLVDRSENFIIMGDIKPNKTPYNGSMWLLRAGTRAKVWTTFDPVRSPELTKAAGIIGSDQAWIAYVLGPREKTYGDADGVLGYDRDVNKRYGGRPPKHARIVFFYGKKDPSTENRDWIKEHWR